MKLYELLNVMDETEEIDIFVDKAKEIDPKTTKEIFDTAEVLDVKNSLEYETIKNFQVWSVGRTFFSTIEIRILREDKSSMTKDIKNKLRKGTTCYTYVGLAGTDIVTFTKCKIDAIGYWDDFFIVRYKGLDGTDVVDLELKYADYMKTWWLKEDKSE